MKASRMKASRRRSSLRPWAAASCLLGLLNAASAQQLTVVLEAAPMAAAAPQAGDEEAALEPYLAQFRPVLKSELSFANRVCDFTDEQRVAAIKAGKAGLTKYVRGYVKGQQPQAAGLWFAGAVGMQPAQATANPRRSIEELVAAAVKEIVTPEQQSKYEDELAHRQAFERQVVVDLIVARIDERVVLSEAQRKAIAKALADNWDDSFGQLDTLAQMGEYLPQLPDNHVVPHLSKAQIELWNGIQRVSFGNHFVGNDQWIGGGGGIDDIDLNEVE